MEDLIYNNIDLFRKIDEFRQFADAFLFLIFLIFVLYLFIFSLASLVKSKYNYPEAKYKYKFAILISAYKGDDTIRNTVDSFLSLRYPQDLYDLFIVSNQMNPATNKELRDYSSRVHLIEANDPKSTKTKALQTAVSYIESNCLKYDIVVIMDTDNLVDPEFLNLINNAFYSGCQAVQTHRIAKERKNSFEVLDAVSEEINNSIFRKGHTRLGYSSALIGSGMAFDYDLFKDNIFKTSLYGVDKQLEKELLIQNVYIEYLENVYTYDEKIKNKESFYNQRRRWIATQFSNLFSGITKLPLAMLKGNWDYCDKLFQWMMPPRIILFGFIILIATIVLFIDWSLAIKWWSLLILLCITFSIAVPDSLVDHKFKKAIVSIPLLFVLMFLNLFRLRGANKH